MVTVLPNYVGKIYTINTKGEVTSTSKWDKMKHMFYDFFYR